MRSKCAHHRPAPQPRRRASDDHRSITGARDGPCRHVPGFGHGKLRRFPHHAQNGDPVSASIEIKIRCLIQAVEINVHPLSVKGVADMTKTPLALSSSNGISVIPHVLDSALKQFGGHAAEHLDRTLIADGKCLTDPCHDACAGIRDHDVDEEYHARFHD